MTESIGEANRAADLPVIEAGWPLPKGVRALVTTRSGGVSEGAYGLHGGAVGGLNLGLRCGDDTDRVLANRARLRTILPAEPLWLNQVHGSAVVDSDASAILDGKALQEPVADAAVSATPGRVLAVLCADCLPVLLSDEQGTCVGVAHAGWRGLAGGVVESTVAALRRLSSAQAELVAWLGPAIGPESFEVGADVLEAFQADDPGSVSCFYPGARPGKWQADLFELARRRLRATGIRLIGGGGQSTVSLPGHYYSHRRDRISGRQAALIWIV